MSETKEEKYELPKSFKLITHPSIIKLFILIWSIVQLSVVYWWASTYVSDIGLDNLTATHSAILGVVIAPLSALQASLVKSCIGTH